MEERGVRTRVNNSQVYVWEDAVQYGTYPVASSYVDHQVGDFVNFDSAGNLVRSPSATAVGNLRGVIVGFAPDSGEYPAFGAPFNRPLVALISPNKTELIMRQIDDNGNYIEPTLRPNDPVKIVYNTSTRRWGVQLRGANENIAGRVVQVLNDGRVHILFTSL
jgi:hypothetical protein